MTDKSRYWDVERCCWVAYESPATLSTPAGAEALAAEALPEQRADETTPADAL